MKAFFLQACEETTVNTGETNENHVWHLTAVGEAVFTSGVLHHITVSYCVCLPYARFSQEPGCRESIKETQVAMTQGDVSYI